MNQAENATFDKLIDYARKTAFLTSTRALLEWDERTLLPTAGGPYRAEQISYLAGLIHQRETDPQLEEWLQQLSDSSFTDDSHSDQAVTIRELQREHEKKAKLPQSLVEELSRAAVLGQQDWVHARKNNDFASFAPRLAHIVSLKREQAAAIGYDRCAYDVLLDDFEPSERTDNVSKILAALREDLVPLVSAINESGREPDLELIRRDFPIEAQELFGRRVSSSIGFSYDRGRLDVTDHPFCSGMGPHDCRITTRYDRHNFPTAFFGILHEAGHGMYDQGLRPDWFSLPPGAFISLGIHESQSRLWENFVGRSRAFWEYFFPMAQEVFPAALSSVELDSFYHSVNDVRPSLIRVEADEATYNLHIIVRFELEQALIDGDLAVAELPDAWNQKYEQYLGIRPPNVADGVLQDIHWSAALFGYFPTYALGNLYAAQLFERAKSELGDLNELFARGQFQPLLDWLRTNIHQHGRCYSASEMVRRITGETLNQHALVTYLREKLEPLYGLELHGI